MTTEEFKTLVEPCFALGQEQDRAIETFCNKLRPYLWIILSRLNPCDPSVAEDALQSAFVKFIQLFHARTHVTTISPGYFVTIAKHCLIDEVRRRKKYVELDELLYGDQQRVADVNSTVNDTLDSYEDLLLIAMERMSSKCRYILERYYLAGIKGPQLAKELGISP